MNTQHDRDMTGLLGGRDPTYRYACRVFDLLSKHGLTVSFAESCTGGMVASAITSVAGSSVILKESYITYCDEAKMRILGVSKETIDSYSAVSKQCAREMAEGVRRISRSDIGVSITGYAGPGGGTDSEPVGTVYVGISIGDTWVVVRHIINEPRNVLRKIATRFSLKALLEAAIKYYRSDEPCAPVNLTAFDPKDL